MSYISWFSDIVLYHGPVNLSYILKTIWRMNIILWDYESVWCDVWPKINVGHCELYFMVQRFCVISWRLFEIGKSYLGIMGQYDPTFDHNINVGLYDILFMVQWFCLISWRLFDIWTSLFGIMSQYDPTFDVKINVGHCDLYFMVQWFRIIFYEDCLM